jgi:hypothetical protein
MVLTPRNRESESAVSAVSLPIIVTLHRTRNAHADSMRP